MLGDGGWRLHDPIWLALVPAAIAATVWLARRRRCGDARLVLPATSARLRIGASPWIRIERSLPWLRGAALVLLVLALARPQAGDRLETISTLGVDVVVALDVSGSMRAEDFRPRNRLEVAKRVVQEFVSGRPDDRMGLVVFAAFATTRCPLTLDHAMLGEFLGGVDFAPPEQDGTAIGLGLATAVNRLRDSTAKSRVVVLVTDGVNNRGQIGPRAAAEAARALGVKIYSVGVGSDGEVPMPFDFPGIGTRLVPQRVELDEELLAEIAETTGGRFFLASDPETLRQVFATIDAMEKTRIESLERLLYRELFSIALVPALGLLLLERALAATRLRRIP